MEGEARGGWGGALGGQWRAGSACQWQSAQTGLCRWRGGAGRRGHCGLLRAGAQCMDHRGAWTKQCCSRSSGKGSKPGFRGLRVPALEGLPCILRLVCLRGLQQSAWSACMEQRGHSNEAGSPGKRQGCCQGRKGMGYSVDDAVECSEEPACWGVAACVVGVLDCVLHQTRAQAFCMWLRVCGWSPSGVGVGWWVCG